MDVPMTRRRLAAIASLVLLVLATVGAVAIAVTAFPRGLLAVAFVLAAAPLAWYGVLHRGAARWIAFAAAGVLLAAVLALFLVVGPLLGELAVVVATALSVAAARAAFAVRVPLPAAPRPLRPVVIWNPRSGDGKAARAQLPAEARERGIEPIELRPGDDLRELVRAALHDGADALAMAGGDGSQAIVAAMAAEAGLPYACIPAGTRNHFALDLGVDRDDVAGALDAFVAGGERRVDLAEVNGRVFVNNVSLGIYADAVQRQGYREAKLRTLLDTAPAALGPEGVEAGLRWVGPDGAEHDAGAALMVSNGAYRLRAVGAGTRPRLDAGELGVIVFGSADGQRGVRPAWRAWATPAFELRGEGPVAAGIDGEAVVLDPPLRFASRPGVLVVRIAPQHPGASPAAGLPSSLAAAARRLVQLAAGREHG
jgi:diacylglycerol kinase family enzyme